MLALSAKGSDPSSGIVWATTSVDDAEPGTVDGTLRAFDASDVSKETWNSNIDMADKLGWLAKFTLPTVANGKVYVPTFSGQLVVYGLRP
jgi:outer membrane protein assembly factor BamB